MTNERYLIIMVKSLPFDLGLRPEEKNNIYLNV